MAEFEIEVDANVEPLRAGLIVTSLQLEKETYLYTTRVARFAERAMEDYVPVGETGNLRRAIKADIQATPFRAPDTGRFEGGGWQARAYIDNRGLLFHTGRRPVYGDANLRPHQDPPIEYALAVNDGRRAMVAGEFGKKKFAWYDPSKAPLVNKRTGGAKSPYGYNIFKGALRARAGSHFIERTQIATQAYAAEQVREFMRRRGRSTISSRSLDRFELGIFQGNPSNLPV